MSEGTEIKEVHRSRKNKLRLHKLKNREVKIRFQQVEKVQPANVGGSQSW